MAASSRRSGRGRVGARLQHAPGAIPPPPTHRDTRDRHRAEEALREARESLHQQGQFLRAVGDRLPKAFFYQVVHEPDGSYRFTYLSQGLEEVVGFGAEHLFEHPSALVEAMVAEDQPRFVSAIAASVSTLSPLDEIVWLKWTDGTLHACHFRAGVRRLPDSRAIACEGIALDITAHRRAEEALLESQARNEAILAALPDMMFVLGRDGTYLDAHVKDEHQLLVPPAQFLGRNMSEVLPGDLANQFARSFERTAADGSDLLDYVLTVGNERRYYEARMVQCGADRILSIVRDVTESKRALHEAQHNRLELATVSRITVLGEIAASLAHELNQPLTAILNNAQTAQRILSRDGTDLPDLREALDDVVDDGVRAGNVIRRLRSWLTRDEAARQALSVSQVIQDVEQLVRSELIMRHVRLTTMFDESLPDIVADRVQLQQVVLNLVLNGMEAMHERPPHERQLAIHASLMDREVQVAVRDHGAGVRADDMDRLFDAFFTTKSTGLGMGLRICASIVHAHGGRIWAVNNPDAGATFCFTLPVVEPGA